MSMRIDLALSLVLALPLTSIVWDDRDDAGTAVASRMYLARVRCGEDPSTVRIAPLR
jgi:hypothetical protein